MRDYRALLADVPCWDREAERLMEQHGEALADIAMQNREELVALCEFIEEHGVRSYLEIGVWTGRLVRALHGIFDFDNVAACDQGYAEERGLRIELPGACRFFRGNSESDAYREWREALGPIDLVLIDGNHNYHAVKRDFERERGFPHRFLALHDITGARRSTTGVRKLWEEIRDGDRIEIVRPHEELGLERSMMGIGVWSVARRD